MELQLPTQTIHVGGVGCKICRYWVRHDALRAAMVKLDTKWGQCMNSEVIAICHTDPGSFRNDTKSKTQVDIEKLSEEVSFVPTSP